jgi:hypothetical protein
MDIVKLQFRDIVATCDWTTHDDVETMLVDLIGWLVYKDKDTVKIACAKADGEYSAVHAVPIGCVTKIETLVSDPRQTQGDPSDFADSAW